VIFKVDGTLSEFENHNGPWLSFEQPFGGGPSNYTLPPDNTYYKVGGSLMVRLPLNSTFEARGSYAKLESNVNLVEAVPVQNFNGNVNYTSVSAALASNPISPLNLRLFYNFFERDNSSTILADYGGVPTTRYNYIKQSTGIDIGYRLPAKTKADVGYEYQSVIRTREDATRTRDHTVYAQIKNSFFDWMSAKVRYQHLIRESDTVSAATAADPFFIDNFRRFDVADKTQDKVKVGIDFQPLNNLTLGVEYDFKHNSYDNALLGTNFNRNDPTFPLSSLLGVQSDTRHEFYVDANYAVSILKLNGFFDLELVERKMNAHENETDHFDWSSKREDTSYTYGFKADVDIIKDVLTAQAGWRYEKAYGSNDFSIPASAVLTVPVQNIGALDNFIRQTLTAKFGYHITKQILVDFGYTYERLKYEDDAWRGYQTADPALILTGAYNNPNYEAHLGFLNLTYKF
jgi:Putative outer membrane beta-barrel porin, MtrB/PioB